ncbi:MAG TPA: hypothetical protein VG267_14050 [Terracidiphilus sp.]|jgi:hypothetical protein|nr:hypothetical protein [Terracidiphilus sp.]
MSRNTVKPTTALARKSITARQIANPGVAKLRKEADDAVNKNSEKIATALVDGATSGNASSARLLVDLADGANWTDHADSVAKVISLAVTEWKKEPPVIELEVTTNPPKGLQPDPLQLTDGNPQTDS